MDFYQVFKIIYFFTDYYVISYTIDHTYERVPNEVIDFTYYQYHIQDKSEEEVAKELTKVGWGDSLHQEYIYEAMQAVFEIQEFRRLE